MFKKKSKTADKIGKTQTGKTDVKSKKTQTGKTTVKSGKTQTVKKPVKKGGQEQEQSDKVLAKLMAIEKETRLKQVRDNVDRLEDEKIAEHLELLLKIMRSEK